MNLNRSKTNVLISTHFNFRTDQNEDTDSRLANYLKVRAKKVILLAQPFPEYHHRFAYLSVFENNVRVKHEKFYIPKGPALLQFLYHIVLTYYLLLTKIGFNFDLCIAMENLSFNILYPLRLVRLIKRLVYYSIDFVPKRFPNVFLNKIYHLMDKSGFKYADTCWVMTKEQFKKRSVKSPVTIVPIGYDTKKIKINPVEKIDFYNIVYAGALRESAGPELTIKTMPLLIKKYPKIRLTVIGSGKDSDKLQKLIKNLKLGHFVDFKGYIANFYDLTEILAKNSLGLAPYKPIKESFSFYSDPSKLKLYMCCGLPVITTDMTTMSNLISKTGSGLIINYSKEALADAISFFLDNKDRYKSYKNAAVKLAKQFDINHILDNAIKKIPD
ncbi:glycosyltransferase [Candidatus Daviesbacteria bacterium]|nr:glycosyltransferase [Candidatus Daviesbacteria bacterium]